MEEHGQLNSELGEESNELEKINDQQHSPDIFGEKKGSDNSEGQVGSSSDSGSDSDSESDSSDSGSDSGSPSRSRSRSRSPVGSGSGSDSDSDSDASSNSKEGSDEDVDIMTSDDDKEPKHKLQASEPGFSMSPITSRTPDAGPLQVANNEKQDDHEFDVVEIEKDVPVGHQETGMVMVGSSAHKRENEKPADKTKNFSPDGDELQKRQNYIVSLFHEEAVKDSSRYEQSDSTERTSKGKNKRGSEVKHLDEKSEYTKRSKTHILSEPSLSGGRDIYIQDNSHKLSSDRLMEDPYRVPNNQMTNGADRYGNTDMSSQKGYNQAFSGKSSSDFQQSGRRSFDKSAKVKVPDSSERPDNYLESLGRGWNYSEKSSNANGVPVQNVKFNRDAQYEDGYANEKKVMRKSKESSARSKQSVPSDSQNRKHGEVVGKFKEGGQIFSSVGGSSPKDNGRTGADKSPIVNGRSSKLQREHSDLELGELREPLPEEATIKKQSEIISFKQSENRSGASDDWNSDFSKGKPAGKSTLDSGKPISPDLSTRFQNNVEGSNRKRNHEDRVEDLTRSQQRAVQSQSQYLSRLDHVESGPQSTKMADTSIKQVTNLEGYGESNKKAPVSAPQLHDSRRGLVSQSKKESKRHSSNSMTELPDGRKELPLPEGNNSDRKRRDSSSDENSCSYTKYEKDEPELKGPIKDFFQ